MGPLDANKVQVLLLNNNVLQVKLWVRDFLHLEVVVRVVEEPVVEVEVAIKVRLLLGCFHQNFKCHLRLEHVVGLECHGQRDHSKETFTANLYM